MQFDTKIAVVLRGDLAVWQKTNVTAFLVSGIAATVPDVVGQPYRDASGNEYLPMLVQPVLVYEADGAELRRAYERALNRGVTPAVWFLSSSLTMAQTTRDRPERGPRAHRTAWGSVLLGESACCCARRKGEALPRS